MNSQAYSEPVNESSLRDFAMIGYILQALTFFTAICTGLIGLIIAYVKLSDARGTWLESHLRWQIETFWGTVALTILGVVLCITIIGIPAAVLVWIGGTIWYIYRIVKGIIRLREEREVD